MCEGRLILWQAEKEKRLQDQLLGRRPSMVDRGKIKMRSWSELEPAGVITQARIQAQIDRKPVLLSPVSLNRAPEG